MLHSKYYPLIVIFIFIIFFGCEREEGPPRETIARMYVDILIAEQTYYFDADSINLAVEQVYVNHGISKESYDAEINRFETDEEKWDEFFKLAKNYLDSLKSMGSPPES